MGRLIFSSLQNSWIVIEASDALDDPFVLAGESSLDIRQQLQSASAHACRRVALPLKYWQSRRAKFCAAIIAGIVTRIIVQPHLRGTFFHFAEVGCQAI